MPLSFRRNKSAPVKPAVKPNPKPHPATISTPGLEFIAGFEGFRGVIYNDAAGHATIGYGHLVHYGKVTGNEKQKKISRAAALNLLQTDAGKAVFAVQHSVKVHLTQPQFDALCSFTFNCGSGALATSSLLRDLNAGRYGLVPGHLMQWTQAGGKVLQGLVNRRRAEGELFAHGTYSGV